MEELLRDAQLAMFQYDIPKAAQHLVEIFDLLEHLQEGLEDAQQEQLQENLRQMNRAMQNQDYLLTADLLEYVIKPLINSAYQ
jgi:flagellin-specific chaperone FliS